MCDLGDTQTEFKRMLNGDCVGKSKKMQAKFSDFQENTRLNEIRHSAQHRKVEFNKDTEILKENSKGREKFSKSNEKLSGKPHCRIEKRVVRTGIEDKVEDCNVQSRTKRTESKCLNRI